MVSIRPERSDNERSENEEVEREKEESREIGKRKERVREGKARLDEIPRNGRRSRKAIYLLGAYLSTAIRERACRQIRHASCTRRINFAAKDLPEEEETMVHA